MRLAGFLALVLGSVGKGVLRKSFVNSVRAIEARDNEAPDGIAVTS